MDAVWCDESIVDTARTATMEQAPGQDDDRRSATLTPPLLPEPDKVTLTRSTKEASDRQTKPEDSITLTGHGCTHSPHHIAPGSNNHWR